MSRTTARKPEAAVVAELLTDAAIEYDDQNVGWVSIWPLTREDPTLIYDPSLYRGQSGIALFFAAYGSVHDCKSSKETARRALHPWVEANPNNMPLENLGGFMGYGSLVYTLNKCGALLDEPQYRETAINIVKSINTNNIQNDSQNDVVFGNAGLLLALLDLLENQSLSSGDMRAIRGRAEAAAEGLLNNRISDDSHEGVGWRTLEDHPQAGYAHGATGIAYALCKAGDYFAADEYTRVAKRALAFEAELFDGEEQNWKNSPDSGHFQCNWCWGAEGILQGRYEMNRIGLDGVLPEDTQAIVSDLSDKEPHEDSLCHGKAGRSMLLEYLSTKTRLDTELQKTPSQILDSVSAGREQTGHYDIPGLSVNETSRASLFRGIAGIGYASLYTQYSDSIPNPLLLN